MNTTKEPQLIVSHSLQTTPKIGSAEFKLEMYRLYMPKTCSYKSYYKHMNDYFYNWLQGLSHIIGYVISAGSYAIEEQGWYGADYHNANIVLYYYKYNSSNVRIQIIIDGRWSFPFISSR